ncbi:DUF1599 domain-containing protein [Aerococcus urinaeequi]|uniref:DUF1599 domain-containing protein n=1 Tax=Aerococcus urinaeequi TaxID=51665 RepID=UPI003B3A3766
MDKQQEFKNITTEMSELYSKKNHDYGDAFGQTFAELGIISAITRISDKTNRLKSLATKDQRVDDERIEDTLMDLANYAVMTLIELQDNNDKQPMETVIAYADGGPVFKTELPMKPIAGVYKGKVYQGRLNLLKDLKQDGFEWLARDEDGVLSVYDGSPMKVEEMGCWDFYLVFDSETIQNDNFPQIKWSDKEPTSIESLSVLKLLCEGW